MYLPDNKRYDELEEMAVEFIEDYGIARFPLDMVGILERMGVRLIPYSGILDQKVRSLVKGLSIDALLFAPGNYDIARMGVCYDPHQIPQRVRMSLAHELGHILCEHPSDDEPYESEAKYFASYFVAPTPLVIECTGLGLYEVIDTFGVSEQCAKIRIERAKQRIEHGAPYKDYELRILESCEKWIGGKMPPRMKRGA